MDEIKSCFNCRLARQHCYMAKQMVGPLGNSIYFITSPVLVQDKLTERIVAIVAEACKKYEREE